MILDVESDEFQRRDEGIKDMRENFMSSKVVFRNFIYVVVVSFS
jgi:hypothetical protein